MRDPRCMHEYLDSRNVPDLTDEVDESDKHVEARDRRYSCLKSLSISIFYCVRGENFKKMSHCQYLSARKSTTLSSLFSGAFVRKDVVRP